MHSSCFLPKQSLLQCSQDYLSILTCQKTPGRFSAISAILSPLGFLFCFFLVSKLLPRHVSDNSQTGLVCTHFTKFKFHFLCSRHQNSLTWVPLLNGSLQLYTFSLCPNHSIYCIQIILFKYV